MSATQTAPAPASGTPYVTEARAEWAHLRELKAAVKRAPNDAERAAAEQALMDAAHAYAVRKERRDLRTLNRQLQTEVERGQHERAARTRKAIERMHARHRIAATQRNSERAPRRFPADRGAVGRAAPDCDEDD